MHQERGWNFCTPVVRRSLAGRRLAILRGEAGNSGRYIQMILVIVTERRAHPAGVATRVAFWAG
ncbi:hypothetical protein [Caldinitratiruptor microaerophilus]|uniref:hypothetical protein n=1 Tax=Caldinitratiruptor microaerophilus TaxID=671077 RepID=UPI00222E3C6E|nr:hypothetical protein [Caldinitratiruptor microaerophilus]